MLTLAFFATPGSLGASTAVLGAALATTLAGDRPVVIFSDRPHPHARRAGLNVQPRAAYGSDRDAVALYDVSDTIRPRVPADIDNLVPTLERHTAWLPIVGMAPQARDFLAAVGVRPIVALFIDPKPGNTRLPMLDDLCRGVLEEGVESLGYAPMTGIRIWTQAWLDLLAPLYRAGSEARTK
jgi:hypothetical protein